MTDGSGVRTLDRLRGLERLVGGANALNTAADQLETAHERNPEFGLEWAVQHLRWSAAELAGLARQVK